MISFLLEKLVVVQKRDATPGRIAHNQQGEFVSERTKGLWMKLAVVSWIVSHLPNLLCFLISYILECGYLHAAMAVS